MEDFFIRFSLPISGTALGLLLIQIVALIFYPLNQPVWGWIYAGSFGAGLLMVLILCPLVLVVIVRGELRR